MTSRMLLPLEITPTEVKQRLNAAEEILLIDVREPEEHQICHIEGAMLIPMREVPKQFERLEQAPGNVIVFCHYGVRSLTVVRWLREHGLSACQSMAGGIDAWSRGIDSTVPRY
jgi:rhodanese-related sulfurtransferase